MVCGKCFAFGHEAFDCFAVLLVSEVFNSGWVVEFGVLDDCAYSAQVFHFGVDYVYKVVEWWAGWFHSLLNFYV